MFWPISNGVDGCTLSMKPENFIVRSETSGFSTNPPNRKKTSWLPEGPRLPFSPLDDFLLYRLSKFEAIVIHVRLKNMQSQHEVFIGSVIRDTSTPWQTHYLPVPNPWFTCDNPVYLWAWTTWNWSSIVFQCCAWDGHWAVQHWFIDSKSTTCNKP